MKVTLSADARRDIDGIWDYTARRWNAAQADRYIRQISQSLDDLGSGTATGSGIDDVRPGYFKLAIGSHFLFYRIGDSEIEIVRVLHQRMDVERHI